MSQNSKFTTPINKFNPKSFLRLQASEDGNNNVWIKYNESQLMLQLSTIFSYHGIPKLGKYYDNDSQRSFFKFPFDKNLEKPDYVTEEEFEKVHGSINTTHDKISELNTLMESKESKELILTPYIKKGDIKKAIEKWKYVPPIRSPQTDEDDEEKPPFWKAKFQTDYPDTDVIKTQLIKVTKEENGSKSTELITTKTVTDFEKAIRFRSIMDFILSPSRVWVKEATKEYGITWKIIKLKFQPPPQKAATGMSLRDYYEDENAFVDSDEEQSNTFQSKDLNKVLKNNDESESDSDEYEDSEDETPEEQPKKNFKKSSSKTSRK